MNAIQWLGQFLLGVSVLGIVVTGGGTQERKPGDAPDKAKSEAPKAAKTPVLHLKVFRLTRADPEATRALLNTLLEEPPVPERAPDVVVAVPLGGGAMPGGVGGPVAGAPGGFGALGFGGGALGMLGALGGPVELGPTHRLAVDDRSGSLLARGTDRDLQLTAELVAVLETPSDKPLPKLTRLRAYRLRHAQAADLVEAFNSLDLDARIVAEPNSNLLFAAGPEERLKEIDEAIKTLDVAGKKQPAKPEQSAQ
jgi:hypothetical protein